MKIIISLVLLLFICGCATYNVENYNKLDLSDKTITVAVGGSGLAGAIKSALRKKGWNLVVYRGPRVTEGAFGENTRLEEYDTFNTRYTIFAEYYNYNRSYDISLVDNKTGEEVMTMTGRGPEVQMRSGDNISIIVKKFMEALDESS